jgi:hypothetical protein
VFIVVGTLSAQSARLQADIPFNFVVDQKLLPAGTYTITPVGFDGSAIRLRSSDLKEAVLILPCACASAPGQLESKIVFQMHGDRWFLWQIWTAGYSTGRQVHLNREIQEAKLAQHAPLVIMARDAEAR